MNKDALLIAEAYKKVVESSLSYDREGNAYDSLQDYHNANVAKEKKQYDRSQKSPYTRGEFDSYNRHPKRPHYYIKIGDGLEYRRVEEEDMSPEEIEAYNAGFEANEKARDFREY